MPIFEFRCIRCGNMFEKLFIHSDEKIDMACPECKSESLERVVSRSHYSMGAGSGGKQPKMTTKSCNPSNRCMTLDIPGPSK